MLSLNKGVVDGVSLSKQLRQAIVDRNENAALHTYESLQTTLELNKPFSQKKAPYVDGTPMHYACKYAMVELMKTFLECGGDPLVDNYRRENCLHIACSSADDSQRSEGRKRAELIETIFSWSNNVKGKGKGEKDKVAVVLDIDRANMDGNSAMHLAGYYGLRECVEKLLVRGSKLTVLNRSNLTCAEYADVGNRVFGDALELALVFQSTNRKAYDQLGSAMARDETCQTSIMQDSYSIDLAGLQEYMDSTIISLSEAIQMSPANTEVLLKFFNWNIDLLKKDCGERKEQVLFNARLLPAATTGTNGSTSNTAMLDVDIYSGFPQIGCTVHDVYIEPGTPLPSTFEIYRAGQKVEYTISVTNGRTSVVATDPTQVPRRSMPSVRHPKTTKACPLCNDMMLETAPLTHFLSGEVVNPDSRELSCGSGHCYCVSCWGKAQRKALSTGDGGGYLQCLEKSCGSILDSRWAAYLLKSLEGVDRSKEGGRVNFLERFQLRRLRDAARCMNMHLCPHATCGLFICVPVNKTASSRVIPQSIFCADGHEICLTCKQLAHPPLSCSDVEKWQQLLVKEAQHVDLGRAHTEKSCPGCESVVTKGAFGCNRMRCVQCDFEFCWICRESWAMHDPLNSHAVEVEGKQCNLIFITDYSKLKSSASPDMEEKSSGDSPPDGYSHLSDRTVQFIQHYARFRAHADSWRMESKASRAAPDRVLSALRKAHSGQLPWLLHDQSENPFVDDSSSQKLNSELVYNVPPAARSLPVGLWSYLKHRRGEIAFITEAFSELQKARLLLSWSYAYDLLQLGGGKNGDVQQNTSPTFTSTRKQFISNQFELEKSVELLSSFISYHRLRNTQSMVMEATMHVRWKRLKLEHTILQCNSDIAMTSPKAVLLSTAKQDEFISQSGINATAQSHAELLTSSTIREESHYTSSGFDSKVWDETRVTGIAIDVSVSSDGEEQPDNVSILSEQTVVEEEPLVVLPKKDPDEEALEHALLLSEQLEKFGCTMYDVLTPSDERLLREYQDAGFTKEESTLLVFEEKFGEAPKTIPSMPTLSAERVNDQIVGRTLSSEEVQALEALMMKGYSLEQSRTAVLRAAGGPITGSSNGVTLQHESSFSEMFAPHPLEQEYNLSDREASAVENVMQVRNCSRKDAVDVVVAERLRRQEAAMAPLIIQMRAPTSNHAVEHRVRSLMMQGFTEAQARVMAYPPIASYPRVDDSLYPEMQSLMSRGYSRGARGGLGSMSSVSSSEAAVQRLMSQGFSRNQAIEINLRPTGSTYQLTQPLNMHRNGVDSQGSRYDYTVMAQGQQRLLQQHQASQPAMGGQSSPRDVTSIPINSPARISAASTSSMQPSSQQQPSLPVASVVVDSLSADAPSSHQAGARLPTDTGAGGVRSQVGGAGGFESGPYLCHECNLTTDFPPEPHFCSVCNRVTQQISHETSRSMRTTDRSMRATDRSMRATDRSMRATDKSMEASFMTSRAPHRNSDAYFQVASHYTHATGRNHQGGRMKPSFQRGDVDLRGFLETEEDILHFTLNESRLEAGLAGDLKSRSASSKISKKNVDRMVSMGFSKQQAQIALGENGNNVDRAVNAIVNNRSTALINVRPNAAGRS